MEPSFSSRAIEECMIHTDAGRSWWRRGGRVDYAWLDGVWIPVRAMGRDRNYGAS